MKRLGGDVCSAMGAARWGNSGAPEKECHVLSALAVPALAAYRGRACGPASARSEGEVGRMAVRRIAHPGTDDRKAKGDDRKAQGLVARDRTACRAVRSGGRRCTVLIRSACWRSRIAPLNRIWCRCGMAG